MGDDRHGLNPLTERSTNASEGRRMKYRTLGRTGIEVSPCCLGTMMLGAMGNPDHDDSIPIIHKALDAGINFVDTADVYAHGPVGPDPR
jgi:diketogulonate reductase-like aldo/keto reductase